MRQYTQSLLLVYCLLFSLLSQAALPIADSQGQALPSLAPLLKKITPAVVNVSVSATQTVDNPLLNDPFFRHFFGIPKGQMPPQQRNSAGSGVIIDAEKGLIVTNHHVIKDADEIRVGLTDGRSFVAKLLGTDDAFDVALLQITAKDLVALPFAASNSVEVGDFVVAIGNPFNLGQTVTTGIISALGRTGLNMERYENFIQTDASINPGNSGGALVNLKGELVGINTAIIAPAGGNVGIGFAIPTQMVLASKKQLEQYGEVRRGQLGVIIQDLTTDLAHAFGLKEQQQGILVSQVMPQSAAASAGIMAEDVIIAANGEKLTKSSQLRNIIGMQQVGDTVMLTILRKNQQKQIAVKLTDPQQKNTLTQNDKQSTGTTLNKKLVGVHLQDNNNGVLVTALDKNSVAVRTGLQIDDIIVAVNRQPVQSVEQIKKILTSSKSETILLQIIRNNTHFYLVIR